MNKTMPVVIFVTGYPDSGFEQVTGFKLKEVQQYISWAQLFAASGITAVTYSNIDPEKDIFTLLQFLRDNAVNLKVDVENISIWSCSGNVPNALAVLAAEPSIKCAALLYGFMLDKNSSHVVAKASKIFRFVNPLDGGLFPKLPPLLVMRAGMDKVPGLNSSIDLFITQGLQRNEPITLLNLPDARHAFDVVDKLGSTQQAIRSIVAFFQSHLIS